MIGLFGAVKSRGNPLAKKIKKIANGKPRFFKQDGDSPPLSKKIQDVHYRKEILLTYLFYACVKLGTNLHLGSL